MTIQAGHLPGRLGWFQPRDAGLAARTISSLSMVAAGVTIVSASVDLIRDVTSVSTALVTVLVAAAIVGFGWTTRYLNNSHMIAWGLLPFVGVAAIVAFDLASGDSSVSAQVFFFFPPLYAASQLPRPGALLVTLSAIAGEAVVVLGSTPVGDGITDVAYVTAVAMTSTVLLVRSAEQQEMLVARLQRQAAIDPLTGLVTRRVLDRAAQTALSGAASSDGTALILLDIDNFKGINDRYGHPAGDEVLVQLAALLMRVCRPGDIVSRLGGDEIALLLPGCSSGALVGRAGSILAEIRTHEFVMATDEHIRVSATAGVAHAPTHAADLRTLYTTADAALYRAKRSGRDQVGTPDENLQDHVTPSRVSPQDAPDTHRSLHGEGPSADPRPG